MFFSFFKVLYLGRVRWEGEQVLVGPFQKRFVCYQILYSVLAKSVWRTKVPLRGTFFVWTTTLGKMLTIDNLRK